MRDRARSTLSAVWLRESTGGELLCRSDLPRKAFRPDRGFARGAGIRAAPVLIASRPAPIAPCPLATVPEDKRRCIETRSLPSPGKGTRSLSCLSVWKAQFAQLQDSYQQLHALQISQLQFENQYLAQKVALEQTIGAPAAFVGAQEAGLMKVGNVEAVARKVCQFGALLRVSSNRTLEPGHVLGRGCLVQAPAPGPVGIRFVGNGWRWLSKRV
jgi:hypothetical protein